MLDSNWATYTSGISQILNSALHLLYLKYLTVIVGRHSAQAEANIEQLLKLIVESRLQDIGYIMIISSFAITGIFSTLARHVHRPT